MAGLARVVRDLAARDSVEAVVVLSADGLPIEHAAARSFDAESLAALTATVVHHANRLGQGAARGSLRNALLEYEGALLVIAQLGAGDCLAVLAAPGADLGPLLYDLRQQRPALAALL
jgi:predicted regulator of Ras-like GTPase activity (Roadblock/LC7/MglB family)